MKENDLEQKRRRPPWVLGIIVLVSFTLLILLQSSNIWKNLAVESANDTLLLYALSSLNFFALVVFGFILTRSILKLARERRALQLGSKIKSRLLIYFVAISILPIIAMAVFSYLFMNRAIERWFTQIPENVVREAKLVQNEAVADKNAKLKETVKMLAKAIDGKNIDNEFLKSVADAGNLTRIEVLSASGEIVAASQRVLDESQLYELNQTLLIIRENRTNDPMISDGRRFDAASAMLSDGKVLVIVPELGPNENVAELVDSSLAEFDRLKEKQITIRQIGLLTLGVLTFLLIFASSWTAFYVAKGLTVPIRALAEGADELARGNLSHKVNVVADDELAMLVTAFNQMSETLVKNSNELRDRRKYIETVLQSLSTGVISLDSLDRITTINNAAIKLFKLEDGNFESIGIETLVSAENFAILEKILNRARRSGTASEQTVLKRESIDGNSSTSETLPVALSAAALSASEGDSRGVVLVIEDLSELIAAQRASAWQEVARRMAHEIKNPLTPIQLSAERIAKRFAQEDKSNSGNGQISKVIEESTATILREVSSLKSMVNEFSLYARLPAIKLEIGNINETILQAAALFEDRDVTISLNLFEDLLNVLIDDEQLKRVIVNLIENAVEAFDKSQKDKQISIKTNNDAARDLVIVEITDNGNGINPADFQKLFQPYFSTKGRGTGLGLAIVQRIILEHRGRINAANCTPHGAKFILELPVAM